MMKNGRIKNIYLKIGVKLKLFERNQSCENYLKIEILKIKFKNQNLKKIENRSFENWNFEKLFKSESFENWKFGKVFENGSFEN